MKLGVLAAIDEFTPSYSIANLVKKQLLGFQDLCSDVVFINNSDGETPEEFNGEVRWFRRLHLSDWFANPINDEEQWYNNAKLVADDLIDALYDIDILLVDDFLMQGWYLPYLWALREVEKIYPDMKVFHIIHSGPTKRRQLEAPRDELYRLAPSESIIYNNSSDIHRVQQMYDTRRVFSAFNPCDAKEFFRLPKHVAELYDKMELDHGDVITMYPTRISEGKQIDKWLAVLGGIKRTGVTVKGLLVNSFSNYKTHSLPITKLRSAAKKHGLIEGEDWCITSELIEGVEQGMTGEEISALNRLCNVFIQTSLSETCSLIQLEAMLSRQLIVLNEDLDCNISGELSGDWCILAKFSSLTRETQYKPSFENYCNDLGNSIVSKLSGSITHKAYLQALHKHSTMSYCSTLLDIMGVKKKVVYTAPATPNLHTLSKSSSDAALFATIDAIPDTSLPTEPGGGIIVVGNSNND